jgi:signal transduction histidine kinase/ActR/RegA family two-component response regulator
MGVPLARKSESFFDEMKRYVGFTEEDACLLQAAGPLMERHLPSLAESFYARIEEHAEAMRVLTGGKAQIEHLKKHLQTWARMIFSGPFDEEYAADRYRIGVRHVLVGLPQRYMISSMGVVRTHLQSALATELHADLARLKTTQNALDKILNIDLNMMCESYHQESMRNLSDLNRKLERANLELAELSRVKTEFLATTSHELRTPLNSILGFTRLILDGLCENREEEHELMRDVLRSAEHLLSIVNDILDIAKIEAGKLRLNADVVNLVPLLQEVQATLGVQAAAKKLTMVDETERVALPPVVGDRARIRQVLINLISNAVKFTDQGWITFKARAFPERGFVELEVQDTGVGISPDKQRLLFEKFRQVDSSFTRQQGGSGLGLAISRKLVEMMGGRIRLWSAGVGCGSTVTFSLPLKREIEDPVHVAGNEALAATGEESGARVLVVDNDPDFRHYLKTLLLKHGYYVLGAATADDALDAAQRFRPQILVVDLALPQRPGAELSDGADVIAHLQKSALTRELHCFMVTGYDPVEVRERLSMLQVTPEILQKPVDGEHFVSRLRAVLERSALAPRAG